MYSKQIQEKKLQSGATVLVTSFPTKGAVSFVGSIKGGARGWGSRELAAVHASMLLEGTTKHSKKEIQQLLDSMAANVDFSVGDERLVFSGRVRTVHMPKLLALIHECLTTPTFPAAELGVLKQRELSNLALASQDTRQQASILLSQTLFAKDHPNYEETTEESKKVLTNITSDFLRSRHLALIDRRSLVFSIAGDITVDKAVKLVEKSFASLPQTNVIFLSYKKSTVHDSKQVQIVIPNKASIDYMLGIATVMTKQDKDYAALLLGIQVLGNRGFASRLMNTVREEEGLTYGVYGYMAGFEHGADGYLYIWATLVPQLFQKGRESIMRQIRLLLDNGVTEEEVAKHRTLYESRMRVQLSNSGAYAAAAHNTVVGGQPLSYLDEFPKKVLALKAKEINAALKKYLIPAKLSEAAAGPVEKNAFTR